MLRFVFFAAILPLFGFADGASGKQHCRASIRHIERGGIGYEDGYTTFEALFASDPDQWAITPFLDARGHIFDNGKWAANAGVGLRALWGNRVYGINGYYDYRNVKRFNSNQVGVGLETLGKLFDFRINGYLPVGAKISSLYDSVFGTFAGHHMLVSQKVHSAMKGANAEFGFHFGKSQSFDFYTAAGPYYFVGKFAPATWGGKARISGTYKDVLTLEIIDSYDRTFHNKFQGQIALSFPIGPKSKDKEQGRTCKMANVLNDRMLQPVERQEIIVIDNPRINTVAIDPATGLPYFFVFVDNTSSSDGTYESPYHSFAQAQSNSGSNDIIYVFPGDGTTTGMDSGIALKANQKLWGSSISHLLQTTVGSINIPSQSNTSPTITNTNIATNENAITLATNNAISGFTITSAQYDAIYGEEPQNLEVSSCTFTNTTRFAIETISSSDASISITNNQFLNNANGISLTVDGTSTVVCWNNTFEGQTSLSEVPIEIEANGNTFTADIENNLFHNNTTGSIRLTLADLVDANLNFLNNTMTNNGTGSQARSGSSIVIIATGTTDDCKVVLSDNTFLDNSGSGSNALYMYTGGEYATLEVTVSGNTISNSGDGGINLETPVTDALTLYATDNTITTCNDNNAISVLCNITTTGNITINNNTITNIGNQSSGIVVNQDFSTLNLTILNNEINGCDGSGIVSYPPDNIDSLTLNIAGNTISNCQNNGENGGSGISFDNYIYLTGTVANNTLSGNISPGVAIGYFTLENSVVCLTLTGNSSDTDPGYSLTNPGSGAFNLSPCDADSVNVGTIGLYPSSDLFTPVQSCPDAAPCPS